jgi:prepilin-type N-terminal cleavage/methylation domain-containing protein
MTRATDQPGRGHEDGFTLVELLMVMVISVVLLLATLQVFDSFSSSTAHQTKVIDANDQARATMDGIVHDLRNSSSVTRADPNDLVYAVKESATVTRYSRYCLDASNALHREQSTTSVDPGTGCPSTATGWASAKVTTMASTNSTANPLFRYDVVTATAVRSISLTFSLDASGGGHAGASTLRASAFLRSQAERAPVVADGDIQTTCTPSGPLVSFGLLSNLINGPVTVVVNGVGLGGSTVQLGNGVSNITATITNGLGLTTTVNKDVSCN